MSTTMVECWCKIIIFFSSILVTLGSWNNCHVKFALWDGYYSIPATVNDAIENNYVYMAFNEELNSTLYSYPDDPRFSIIFDSYKNIAGICTCYIKSDLGKQAEFHGLPFPYNFTTKPLYSSHNYWNSSVWCTTVLFIRPDKLKAGGRKVTNGVVAEDLFVKLNGNYTKMPKDECDVVSQGFTKEACFLGMGMHYFYGMTPEIDCNDFQGVFLLYDFGELTGLGIIPFGSFTHKDRNWYEAPPANVGVVADVVPTRPACLLDWVKKYGTISLHIYFRKFPRLTFCFWPWQGYHTCGDKDV